MFARSSLVSFTLVAGLTLAACGSGGDADPFVGTWNLNAAKSTFVPAPGPKNQVLKISGPEQARTISVDVTPSAGNTYRWEVSGAVNAELPVKGDNPNADTYRFRRLNATTTEAYYRKGGKPTLTQTAVVSADGQVLTVTGKGTNFAGLTVNTVAVYDKAPGT
jgi:hypothetical protein